MRIKVSQIAWRDVIRCPEFAGGRRWTSPDTGMPLVIVGESGDADVQARSTALFVHDPLPWSEQYELSRHFPDYVFARRLDAEGAFSRSEELIGIGKKAAFDIDLLGYGPTGWLHDGITGAEIEALARAEHGWKPVLWPRPEKMAFIQSLKTGQVIRSEQFSQARPHRFPDGTVLTTLYHEPIDPRRDDPARGAALYRVESTDIVEEWHDLGDCYGCRIRARRLGHDGMVSLFQEFLEFRQQMDTKDDVPGRSFHPVELVDR